MKVRNMDLETNLETYQKNREMFFHMLIAHECYLGKIDLPDDIRKAYEMTKVSRDTWLNTPFYREE